MPRSIQRLLSTAQLPAAERFWRDLHHNPGRRRAPRVHANVPVCLFPADGTRVPIVSDDLSYHGMQVCCDRATAALLRPHSHGTDTKPTCAVTLQLEFDGSALRVSAHARIAYVTLIADSPVSSEIAIGMSFVRFEDGAQQALERFIEHHLVPAGWP